MFQGRIQDFEIEVMHITSAKNPFNLAGVHMAGLSIFLGTGSSEVLES